jgi:hypothetical protein
MIVDHGVYRHSISESRPFRRYKITGYRYRKNGYEDDQPKIHCIRLYLVNVQIFLKKKLYCTKLEQIVNTKFILLKTIQNEVADFA